MNRNSLRSRRLQAVAASILLLAVAVPVVLILREGAPQPAAIEQAADSTQTRQPPCLLPIPKVSRVDELLDELARLRADPTVANNRRRARAIGRLARMHHAQADPALRTLALDPASEGFERHCAIHAWWVTGEREELLAFADAAPDDAILTAKLAALQGFAQEDGPR